MWLVVLILCSFVLVWFMMLGIWNVLLILISLLCDMIIFCFVVSVDSVSSMVVVLLLMMVVVFVFVSLYSRLLIRLL